MDEDIGRYNPLSAISEYQRLSDPIAPEPHRHSKREYPMPQPDYIDPNYPLSALTSKAIGACKVVYRHLGPGFNEILYQRALALELPAHGVDFSREVWIDVFYRGQKIGRKRVDFIVSDSSGSVMIEIKAKAALEDVDFVQTLSYLKASGYKVGLLINFGGKQLEVKRLANKA